MKFLGDFDQTFLDHVPEFDQELIRNDFNPEDFVITKSAGYSVRVPQSYNYTVTVQDRSFTVNMPNDIEFLKYFCELCFPPEQESQDMQNVGIFRNEHRFKALLQRLEKWLTADPLEQDNDQNL